MFKFAQKIACSKISVVIFVCFADDRKETIDYSELLIDFKKYLKRLFVVIAITVWIMMNENQIGLKSTYLGNNTKLNSLK